MLNTRDYQINELTQTTKRKSKEEKRTDPPKKITKHKQKNKLK